ncbi:MAG TPA: PQQ-dependent sugar dehydrogenase [Gammaproteobacteria bacterium]|nr:PQQ-dependent sugar dehydrogenase [Gammaproteobacteria bacterium]
MRPIYSCAALSVLGFVALPLAAQHRVAFNNGIPVAPSGLKIPSLPNHPVEYKTAEGQDIRVVVVARGLAHPWSLAFLANGTMLVTERPGRLRIIRDDQLDPEPVAGIPEVRAMGLSGLLDVVLHPRFASNHLIYLSYDKPSGDNGAVLAVARGEWDGRALKNVQDIFVAGEDTTSNSRLAFGADGMLYVTTFGGMGDAAQDPNSDAGKVLRLRDDGSVPDDNPFVGKPGYRPEIFTLGHRSPLGLAVRPGTNEIWELEMGPNGGDELNLLHAGANYGWPRVSLGRTYPGPWQSQHFQEKGYENPVVYWMPSISTSGLAFYTGDKLPKWKGDVFVGGMRYGETPGTGQLQRILFNENMQELRREPLLVDLHQRIRDVRQGPDGLLYVLTDDPKDGGVLRIEPAAN